MSIKNKFLTKWHNSIKSDGKLANKFFGIGYRKGVNDFTREIEHEYSDNVVFIDKKITIKRDFWEKLKLEMMR